MGQGERLQLKRSVGHAQTVMAACRKEKKGGATYGMVVAVVEVGGKLGAGPTVGGGGKTRLLRERAGGGVGQRSRSSGNHQSHGCTAAAFNRR